MQTLLAVLAIALAAWLMLQTQGTGMRESASAHEDYSAELASGVAVATLERLAAYPFDGGEGASGTEYTHPDRFGTDVSTAGVPLDSVFSSASFDDLDDFDGVSGAVAAQAVTDPEGGPARSFDMEVDLRVTYARRDGANGWVEASPGQRSPFKLATVTVSHATLPNPVRFGRLYVAP